MYSSNSAVIQRDGFSQLCVFGLQFSHFDNICSCWYL